MDRSSVSLFGFWCVSVLSLDYSLPMHVHVAELLVDEAMSLDHVGGVYGGNIKPTPFLCLMLKMLQIQPSKDIIIEFIRNPDYK